MLDIRNTTLHAAEYELDTPTAIDCLDAIKAVLSDPKELVYDKDAQMALANVEKVRAFITGLKDTYINILFKDIFLARIF